MSKSVDILRREIDGRRAMQETLRNAAQKRKQEELPQTPITNNNGNSLSVFGLIRSLEQLSNLFSVRVRKN